MQLPMCAYATEPIPHSIIISKSYQTFITFPTGDYSVFFMEDFLSNKDSSEKYYIP